ncbi:uncharacterized protein EDB93DRAFT_1110660, partial [Suillus bovinus]|uniref:uncharacterized protein n=1 Tax=Suillus bovinus TaxID=48563 RepID=UPI001B872878
MSRNDAQDSRTPHQHLTSTIARRDPLSLPIPRHANTRAPSSTNISSVAPLMTSAQRQNTVSIQSASSSLPIPRHANTRAPSLTNISSVAPSMISAQRQNTVSIQSASSSLSIPWHANTRASAPIPTTPPWAAPWISSSKDRNYFYLKEVDSILFSATQSVCPFPSQVKADFRHEDPDPDDLFQLRFQLSRYIQIAATPDDSELQYTGPLFQRLAAIRIVTVGTTYSLSAEQQTSWKWLENTLHHAASILSIDSLLPMDFSMLPLPSSYGYLRYHKKHSHALRCAQKSRLAFHSLIGLVNLFYGRALVRFENSSSSDPRRPLPPPEVLVQSGLSNSHVCDIIDALKPEMLGRCVGVVLDPRSSEFGILYPYLNRIRVPVWVQIGSAKGIFNTKSLNHPLFQIAIPTREEELRVRAMVNQAMADDVKPSPSNPDPDSLHRWDALVEDRKAKLEEFLSRASNAIKERVKKRLQDAASFIIPTQRDGTRFFMWYRSKQGRFRGELDYEDAKKEFASRRKGHFVYDEISNQWDICSLFDKDEVPTHDDTEFEHPLPEVDPTPVPLLREPPTLPSDHNEVGRSIVHKSVIGQDILLGTSLEEVLFSRYGLICHTQSEIQSASDFLNIQESQIVDTYTVRKYIMEAGLRLDKPSNEFAIRYFISSLVLELEPPSVLWDLHPNDAGELLTRNEYFKIERVKDSIIPGYLMLPIIPKYARTWNLFVHNATSVVQCIREKWGPSLEDVILCLFERGIPFKVLFKVTYPPLPRPITVFESNR